MITSERKGRAYEINAFNNYLGLPCKNCGTTLDEHNQSKGWRGNCKICRQAHRALYQQTHCVICNKNSTSFDFGRCNTCHKDYKLYLANK